MLIVGCVCVCARPDSQELAEVIRRTGLEPLHVIAMNLPALSEHVEQ